MDKCSKQLTEKTNCVHGCGQQCVNGLSEDLQIQPIATTTGSSYKMIMLSPENTIHLGFSSTSLHLCLFLSTSTGTTCWLGTSYSSVLFNDTF